MIQRIIYTNEDGGVSVVAPSFNSGLSIKAIAQKDVPAGYAYEIVDIAVIPSDRTFRNAWRKNNIKIDVDLPEAKLIAHKMRRIKRGKEFIPLDGDNPNVLVTPEIETERVIIRGKYVGIQTAFDNANSVNALKGLMIAQGWID